MSRFKGLILLIEVVLVGLVFLYIAFGRKGKKKGEGKDSLPKDASGDIDPD